MYDLSLASDYIEERVAAKFLRNCWFAVLNEDRPNAGNRGNFFEGFVRQKFSQAPANYNMICCQSVPFCPT